VESEKMIEGDGKRDALKIFDSPNDRVEANSSESDMIEERRK
jgi:hypothetical protein